MLVIWHTLPGITIDNFYEGVVFALILTAVNSILRPILLLLTLPITVLTLGLFTLVVNIFTFWFASELSYGVHVESFSAAFWGAFIVWITSFFVNRLIWNKNP